MSIQKAVNNFITELKDPSISPEQRELYRTLLDLAENVRDSLADIDADVCDLRLEVHNLKQKVK